MKGSLRCLDGRLMRRDPQCDDPNLETDLGVCPWCMGKGCALPKAQGVSRMADNDRAILVSFSKPLSDDEMRDFEEYVKEWEQ